MHTNYFWLRRSLSCKLLDVGNGFSGDIDVCLPSSCALLKLVPGWLQRADMKWDGLQVPPCICSEAVQ